MEDLIRRIRTAVKQWFCPHNCTKTRIWADEKEIVVYTETKCEDCGAMVDPFDPAWVSSESSRILHQIAEERRGNV